MIPSDVGGKVIERIGRYELIAPRPGQENTFLARRRGAGAFERYVVVRIIDMSGETAGMLRLQADEVLWPFGHLHHQHLRNVIDVEEHADRMLIVTEYVHGCTVRDVIEGGVQLPYDFGLTVVAHAASALHHMHTRTASSGKPLMMVHREVSPSMLWVGFEGAVKLGLAIPVARTVQPGVAYMSPEQVLGKPVGVCSDIFSLGSVLYELTTGQRPFDESTDRMTLLRIKGGAYEAPSKVIANFPPELETIITRALQVEPGARFETAEAMRSAIAALGHHYELVLGDAAIVEVISQLFEAPVEPWLQASPAPEPTSDGALAYDFDLPSVRPQKNPMRSATELVDQLAAVLDPPTGRPRTPLPELPEAHTEFDESVPTRMAPTPAELLAAATKPPEEEPPTTPPSSDERVQSIQRLFTESAFDPRETPASPIATIDDAATRRHVTNRGIGELPDPLVTTDGIPVLPATVVPPPAPPMAIEKSSAARIALIAVILIVLGGLGIVGYWLATREDTVAASDPPPVPVDSRPADVAASPDSSSPDATVRVDAHVDVSVMLTITSVPSGATVLLDGKRLGKTPYEGRAELAGKPPHAVKVRLTGYNTVKLDITGDTLDKQVVLTKAKPKEEPKPDGD